MNPAALFDLTGRVALVSGAASGSIVNIGSSMTAMGRGHIAYVMAMGAVVQTREAPNGGPPHALDNRGSPWTAAILP
jgi:hypothetical protein